MKRILFSAACAALCIQALAFLSGCGGNVSSSNGNNGTPQPSIGTFSAAAGTIEAGSSVNITADFSNGTAVITPGNIAVTSGMSVSVSPASTTTYTLTVTGSSGTTAATQTVTVTVDPAPAITSFAAGAAAIETGTSTTLIAVFANGTGVITPGNITVTSGTPVTVNPASTTTYTLTVTPPVGTIAATQTATVTVDAAPTIASFTAGASSIEAGSGGTTLTAVFSGGAGVITPGNITVTSGTPVTVNPTSTTTYTLTVTPPVGTIAATQTATVTVGSAPSIASFTAGASPIEAGTSTTLTANFTGGAGVITPGNISVTSGTPVNVSPTANTVYTLTVTPSVGAAITQTATVDVAPAPSIASFTAGTNPLAYGGSTSLTATFSGGTGAITPGNIAVTSGTPVSVDPTTTTEYTLTVTPPVGTITATQTLTLNVDSSISVCLNPSCSGPKISDLLEGMNLASWYDVIGNASPIVSAFQTAGIKAVRWPGGSWSDGYHWDGQNTYPTDTTIAAPTGCDSESPVGDDTFANFVNDLVVPGSLDLAVTADYGSNPACNGPGTPSEAAGWAAYAESLGTPIHYMTIGNEEYGSWEYDLHTGTSQNNPTVYACEINGCSTLPSGLSTGLTNNGSPGFYSAIKTAVENAGGTANTTLVGVIVNANSSCCAANADNWDSTVLKNAAGSYDFVEFHYYPQNPPNESDSFIVHNAARNFTSNITTIQNELKAVNEAGTPIYVGEIGSVSSNPGVQSWSITQGLYAGQMLGEAMNDGVARMTWWIGFGNCNGNQGNDSSSLYGWQNFGAYNVFSDGPGDTAYPNNSPCEYGGPIGTMSPTAEAFNLAQNVLVNGEYPQQSTVTGDTGDVRAYAATHGTGTALMLFNLNETTPETVTVTLGSQSTSTDVQVMTYDKQIYDYTDVNCASDPTCSLDPNHNYSVVDWAPPTTTDMGQQSLPLTLTLQPWSMNVVIVQQ